MLPGQDRQAVSTAELGDWSKKMSPARQDQQASPTYRELRIGDEHGCRHAQDPRIRAAQLIVEVDLRDSVFARWGGAHACKLFEWVILGVECR